MKILVMSSDNYEFCWKPFFDLKNKYWKDCPYETLLCTETKQCEFIPTINTKGSWTKRLRTALEQINDKYVLLMLEDFFLHRKVDQKEIDSVLTQFNDNTACFNFEKAYYITSENKWIKRQNKEPYLCSCQPSIWNREKLISLLQKDMTPWEWELQILDSKYEFYINTGELIFDIGYYKDKKPWGVVQAKICDQTFELFKKEGIYKKLSIITPYYKTLELTKKLIMALKPQLTNECEWIIIDDGCNEKQLDIEGITVIHTENGGVSRARNIGIDNAIGEYIVFIDSDDLVSEDYITKILDKTKEEWDYCYISFDSPKGQTIIKDIPPSWNNSVWNAVIKRNNIANNRFPENTQYGEETIFNINTRFGKKANITDILYHYNIREGSLTDLYCKGKLSIKRPLKAQIVMFLKFVSKIGGVETFLYEFFKEYHDKHDILFLYEETDPYQLQRYKKFVKCKLYENEKIECETYINVNCNKNIADNVTATSGNYYDMIHTDYTVMGWKYTKHPKTTMTICVSEIGKQAFLKQYPKSPCMVIHNMLNLDKPNKCLFLISATRLSHEKGYERMKTMAKRLNELGKNFFWLVFTNDIPDEAIDGFVFMKPRYNVCDFVKRADYYVSLSDTECFSYSNQEAFALGVPIISTNYPSIYEQGMIVGKTGYALEMNLSNLDEVIEKMYDKIPSFKPILYNEKDKWKLGKETKSNYVYNENEPIKTQLDITDKWIAQMRMKDDEGNIVYKDGEPILKSTERIRILLENGIIRRK